MSDEQEIGEFEGEEVRNALSIFRRSKKRAGLRLGLRTGGSEPVMFFRITNGRKVKGGAVEAEVTLEQAANIARHINNEILGLSRSGS